MNSIIPKILNNLFLSLSFTPLLSPSIYLSLPIAPILLICLLSLSQSLFFSLCLSLSQVSAENMASLCERQQRCVKASIVSSWQLVEAQDQLCGLELHGSESVEQARARALASSAHLSQTEEEWRRKESMLESRWSPVLGPDPGHGGFDKVHTHAHTHNSQRMNVQQQTNFTYTNEKKKLYFYDASCLHWTKIFCLYD